VIGRSIRPARCPVSSSGEHAEIMNIRGIGPKIASFFLRDVAIRYAINLDENRDLLQPVDRWILRFAQKLDGELPRSAVSHWMVSNASRPELANAGMWYFGARIARLGSSPTRGLWKLLPSLVS
jgi:hypothetical protein